MEPSLASVTQPELTTARGDAAVAFPPEWRAGAPATEKDIGRYFDEQFSGQFEIYSEVFLKTQNLGRLRVDRVLRERQGRVGGLWAIELKRPLRTDDSFTTFTCSLAQAMDEMQGRIESDLVGNGTDWFGQQLRFAFVFPCGFHIDYFEDPSPSPSIREGWAQGALRLAGKFGVGVISYSRRRRQWGFFLSGHAVYWLRDGPTDLAQKHAVSIRRGSAR